MIQLVLKWMIRLVVLYLLIDGILASVRAIVEYTRLISEIKSYD